LTPLKNLIYIRTSITSWNSDIYNATFNLRLCHWEKVRDVRTKINNGGDSELNFLNRDFLRNNLQLTVFNLQMFSENKTQPTRNKLNSKTPDQKLKMEQIQKNFFLKSVFLKNNLQFLVSYLQVLFEKALCVRGLRVSRSLIWHILNKILATQGAQSFLHAHTPRHISETGRYTPKRKIYSKVWF
jgi:hypothetical protein